MYVLTDMPNANDRAAVAKLLPWADRLALLTGRVRGSLDNQSIEVIDAALGPNHLRTALVTFHEAHVVVQGAFELAESLVCQRLIPRLDARDPLKMEAVFPEPAQHRLPLRIARYHLENAATKSATCGDHLANAHLRFAWEANVASADELRLCGFDPETLDEPKWWSDVNTLRNGL
jgi:hypothetical protein